VAFNKTDVSIAEGCDMQKVNTLSISKVRLMRFNDQCTVPARTNPGPGSFNLDSCTDNQSQVVFVVAFGNRQRSYASSLEFDGGDTLIIDLVTSAEKIRGPIQKVIVIDHICIEKKYIPSTSTFPKDFVQL